MAARMMMRQSSSSSVHSSTMPTIRPAMAPPGILGPEDDDHGETLPVKMGMLWRMTGAPPGDAVKSTVTSAPSGQLRTCSTPATARGST